MTATIAATIAAILTGIALKSYEAYLARINKRKEQLQADQEKVEASRQQIIVDLRNDMAILEKKYTSVVEEFEEWKDKYWALREEHVNRLSQLIGELNKLKGEDENQGRKS